MEGVHQRWTEGLISVSAKFDKILNTPEALGQNDARGVYIFTNSYPAKSKPRKSISVSFSKIPCSRYAFKLASQKVQPLLHP